LQVAMGHPQRPKGMLAATTRVFPQPWLFIAGAWLLGCRSLKVLLSWDDRDPEVLI
jgi:hypothetical protein